jgi:hypothetical protein
VLVDENGDLSFRSRRRRRRWRDGEESLKSESLVSEQLLLVEIGIETEGGIETIGHALVRRPHPIAHHHVHGRGRAAGTLVAVHHLKAVHFLIRYGQKAETVQEDHIPGTMGLIFELVWEYYFYSVK